VQRIIDAYEADRADQTQVAPVAPNRIAVNDVDSIS